jgi:hypothetical protein
MKIHYTLREHYTPAQHTAASLLDRVRSGDKTISLERINWALSMLGEPIDALG